MWPFGFWNKYPYTDFHEMNDDWILARMRGLEGAVTSFIKNWSSPKAVSSYQDFTDPKLIYLYTGSEIGYNTNHWYYNENGVWKDGGLYGSAVVDEYLDADSSNALRNSTLSTLIDFVTPQYYGAAGTGLVDDTAAINEALQTGKPVLFPKGVYLVSEQILIPANSILIGHDATIRWAADVSSTFLFGGFGISNVQVEGITFDFNGQTTLKYGMSFTETEGVMIRNCEFLHSYGYALRLSGSNEFIVDSCKFHDITGASGNPGGGVFATDAYDGVVSNCYCDTVSDHFAYFAGSVDSHNIAIINNTIMNSGFTGGTSGAAISLYANAHSCSVINNVIKNCRSGIQVSDYGGYATVPHEILIDGCTIESTAENGITAHGLSAAHLANCVIKNVTCKNIDQDAVSMRYADFCTIDSLNVNTVARYGIELSYTNYCYISDSNIRECTQIAVLVGNTGASDNGMFTGINCINTGSGQTGLYVRTGTNNKVFGFNATGFTSNYSNTATGTVIFNDNNTWADVSAVSSLTGTSITWTPVSDGFASMSESPSDNTDRYITVTDTTASHVVATSFSTDGISASVNFPYVNGHVYTINRNESVNSLQVQTFRLH